MTALLRSTKDYWLLTAIVLAVVTPYLGLLENGFVWLDQKQILEESLIARTWGDLPRILLRAETAYKRPVFNLVHSLDHAVWGKNPLGFHLTSLLLHVANVVLLYRLFIAINIPPRHSFLVALLWGLHPLHAEPVGLLLARADLLATFFVLACLNSLSGSPGDGRARIRRQIWAVTFYSLALSSKELSAGLLLFLLVSHGTLRLIDNPPRNPGVLKTPSNATIVAAMIVTILFFIYQNTYSALPAFDHPVPLLDRILTAPSVYVDYILKSLTTLELTTNDSVVLWLDAGIMTWIYWGGFLALLSIQVLMSLRSIHIAFGLLWYNVFLLPVLQVIPILHFRADRFLYLPSIGAIFSVYFTISQSHSSYPHSAQKSRKALFAIALALPVAFGVRTALRTRDFRDDTSLFEKLVQKYPACREAHSFLALAYSKADRVEQAENSYLSAIKMYPGTYSYIDLSTTLMNYGVLLMRRGRNEEAISVFDRAIAHDAIPNPELYFNRAIPCLRLGRHREARAMLERYLTERPSNTDGLFLLGKACLLLGDYSAARKALGNYLRVYPGAPNREAIERTLQVIAK